MVALPAAGTVSWGVQALTPTFVTAETMARAGANKISYKHIEECTWHQNAKLSAKISNKTLISAKFYIVQWFMVSQIAGIRDTHNTAYETTDFPLQLYPVSY